jgi:hypothetical protein
MCHCEAVLPGLLLAGLLSIPGVCKAQNCVVADFRVTLTAEYVNYSGRIKAAARWRVEEGWPIQFRLGYDGRTIALGKNGKTSATGYAEFWSCSYEEFPALKDAYFAQPHTFTLAAVGNMGDETTCAVYVYKPADILRIENRVASFSDLQRGMLEIDHHPDANEGSDIYDVAHSAMHLPALGTVMSLYADPTSGAICPLALDARPKDSLSDIVIALCLESETGAPVGFAQETGNELFLSLPRQNSGYDFRPHPLTLQQYDPLDPGVQYPLYDVRKIVADCDGLMWLPPLKGSYASGVPYAHFRLSFTRKASGDLGDDGRLDLRDFAVLARDWRAANRPTIADLGGSHGLGVPDGSVDELDLMLFSRRWAGDSDGFESGEFESLGWYGEGDAYWKITSAESQSGLYCAQAGKIQEGQRSRLAITIECKAGEVRFWRKVSSQPNYNFLRFRSGNAVLGEWSGELDWELVSIPVQAGKRTLSWEYVKTFPGWMGSDTAWIDLVSFPTGDLETGGE